MRKLLVLTATLATLWGFAGTTTAQAHNGNNARSLWNAFLCIHKYEGAWNDPNGPYYGGLQMDLTFQAKYGYEYLKMWGTADHWPPYVQIAVAIKAYASGRGFYPWPHSARVCGLI